MIVCVTAVEILMNLENKLFIEKFGILQTLIIYAHPFSLFQTNRYFLYYILPKELVKSELSNGLSLATLLGNASYQTVYITKSGAKVLIHVLN